MLLSVITSSPVGTVCGGKRDFLRFAEYPVGRRFPARAAL